jgi:glyoxylase-like metal-dependent hydrolase (beta-lactamase superfamily II)
MPAMPWFSRLFGFFARVQFLLWLALLLSTAARSAEPGLHFIPGPVNGVVVERHGKSLVVYGDPTGQGTVPDLLLLTEARRDATWAARRQAGQGARVVAPASETEFLLHPERFWAELREKRFHDYAQQTTKMPVQTLAISQSVKGGDTIAWADLRIRVIDTPGYTRGAVSYWLELDRQKIAFTGDLIRDDGKLPDLFSLQDAIPTAKIGGYHGWAGRLGDLMTSLERIAAEKPDYLIPLRGPIVRDPLAAIGRLRQRIRAVYRNYLSIDALRWYFKDDHIRAKAKRVLGDEAPVDWMEMAETFPLPENIVAISNSRLILSADHAGFLVDCGGTGIVETLRQMRAAGKLTSIEHVFVTHYHDDHTDALPVLIKEFGAQVHACGSLIDLIEHPGDYRLPCLTKNPTPVTAKHHPGDQWRWKEFQMTLFDFPGQTLHHNALLVEQAGGWKACFAGDSFTPSGIDDYCLQNRNFLREGQGFFRCLDQLGQLPLGCFVINQHVEPAFRFTSAQVARMRNTLGQRLPLLNALLPFDDPNFGLDESWVHLHPYWIMARPGQTVTIEARITNHSDSARTYQIALHANAGFRLSAPLPLHLPAHTDGTLKIPVELSKDVSPGLNPVVADVGWDNTELREWTEAVVEIVP